MTCNRFRPEGLAVALTMAAALSAGSGSALAARAGDWIVRGSITNISPNDDTGGVNGQLSAALSGADVDVESRTGLGITAGYFVTDNVAIELLASTVFEHDLSIEGGALDGTELGSVEHLPPTLSVQYHFDLESAFRPYVGLGINYTIFSDEDVDSEAAAAGVTDIDVDDSAGLAAQVGVDYELGNGWLLNADLRYIDIEAEFTVKTATGSTDVDVDIDPWVTSIGFGYRF